MRFAIVATVLATLAAAVPVAEPRNPKFDYVSLGARVHPYWQAADACSHLISQVAWTKP